MFANTDFGKGSIGKTRVAGSSLMPGKERAATRAGLSGAIAAAAEQRAGEPDGESEDQAVDDDSGGAEQGGGHRCNRQHGHRCPRSDAQPPCGAAAGRRAAAGDQPGRGAAGRHLRSADLQHHLPDILVALHQGVGLLGLRYRQDRVDDR